MKRYNEETSYIYMMTYLLLQKYFRLKAQKIEYFKIRTINMTANYVIQPIEINNDRYLFLKSII